MVEIALGTALAAIGAGVAVGMAGLGSGIGQGIAAAGSVGAVAEDPDMFARGIIFHSIARNTGYIRFLDCHSASWFSQELWVQEIH